MKILIIGANGQLGTDLCKVLPQGEQVPLTIKELDITNKDLTCEIIHKHAPDVVINTAAYHQVDKCEENVGPAFEVNTYGVKNLAQACKQTDSVLVHISTDYVFNGEKKAPYIETDSPDPQSIYAISKYAGEQCVKYRLKRYFIIRSTGLYGVAGCMGKDGANFVEGMIKRAKAKPELKVVADEVLCPTYTLDLAKKINELIRTKYYGLYHIVNPAGCSWYDFTCRIFDLLGNNIKIHKITSAEFKSKAKRPKYSVLKNANLEKIGMNDLRPWPDALKAYLIEKGHLKTA